MSTLLQDLRFGLRMMRKTPVVSGVAALSLAAGIAATATIFAIVNGFLFKPLPFEDQSTLALIREGPVGEPIEMFGGPSIASLRIYEERSRAMKGVTAYSVDPANLTGVDAPEQLNVVSATPNFFQVLGVAPSLGRGFLQDEGTEGRGNVVVLEHDFWEERLASDPEILGRTLVLDGEPYTVVGVMPETFDLIPANIHVIRPTDYAAYREDFGLRGFIAFARLAPGATADQLDAELKAAWPEIAARDVEATRGNEPRAIQARSFFPGRTDTLLVLLLAAVTLFGLLIACANVANLLLSRAEQRRSEMALRTALGAGSWRILRQLLTESVALGLVAGGIGVLLAVYLVEWVQRSMPPMMPRSVVPALDPEVLAATVGVSILSGIAFGLAPALHASRGALRETAGSGSRSGTPGRTSRRLRNFFVIGEFAVALALLTASGFLMEAFDRLTNAEPGYRQEGLLTFTVSASETRYPGSEELRIYHDELLAELAELPGNQGVAAMIALPRSQSGTPSRSYEVEGRVWPDEVEPPRADLQAVNPEYFATMEIPLVSGRLLEAGDRADGLPVVVVSEGLARQAFPGASPLGERILLGREDEPRTIVGVVANTVQERIELTGDGGEAVFVPLAQMPARQVSFALRFPGDPNARAGDLRQAVWRVDAEQPVAGIQTLDEFVAASLSGPRILSTFVSGMGVIALILAAMGIYGVLAHAVAQQHREIGIRMALGAERGVVVGMITRKGLRLVGIGLLCGLPLALLMHRAVASALNLFDTGLGITYPLAVTGALIAVAVVATLLPARRASGVQLVTALREG